MKFRLVEPGDDNQLQAYYESLTDESRSRFAPHAFDFETLKGICSGSSEDIFGFVGIEDNEIIAYAVLKKGYLSYELERLSKYPFCVDQEHDYTLAPSVSDQWQSKGVGNALMQLLIRWVRAQGGEKIVLWGGVQLENQKAVRFYLKHGFRMLGQFEHHGENLDMVLHLQDDYAHKANWIKDLTIYEINPYAFTSPNQAGEGDGSGTFRSLLPKLDYLKEIGINSIWLAGFSHASNHFRGINSVYACIEPDYIDPKLGTEQDLKILIEEAHQRGIRIFLDVITHGVTFDSPLVDEYPEWFEGSSWGMADYNYDHPEFRSWWIRTWTHYAIDIGVDGYRLDGPNGVAPSNKVIQIWDEIIEACNEAGKEIIVFPENTDYHFQQGLNEPDLFDNLIPFPILKHRFVCKAISNHDFGIDESTDLNHYRLQGSRCQLAYFLFSPFIPILMSGEEFDTEYIPLPAAEKDLFGGGGPSSWLYASWLQWDQLQKQKHLDMLNDFKELMKIRAENRDILHADLLRSKMLELDFESGAKGIPAPFLRYASHESCILVCGNNSDKTVNLNMSIPTEKIFGEVNRKLEVADLWNNNTQEHATTDLEDFHVSIPPDKTPGGGFRVFRIEKVQDLKSENTLS